uniref:Uncharacterized protein n=1 Tax=Cyclophora tenuis TaxID=216820 RepID=A0A7S1GMF9_CYCTE
MKRQMVIPALLTALGPLENAWEFYVNREEIADELLQQGIKFAQRNSVRALGTLGILFAATDVLARMGYIGKPGEGILRTIRGSETIAEAVGDHVFARVVRETADFSVGLYQKYKKLGSKSKFAVAFSAGAFFSQTLINATVTVVKLGLTSFVLLEGLSFAGVIGEPGESIVDWVDSNKDKTAEWMKQIKRFRLSARDHISFANVEDFYEAAVEEEKVASLGFAIGSLLAIF